VNNEEIRNLKLRRACDAKHAWLQIRITIMAKKGMGLFIFARHNIR
jgi:hypothetical protein